MGTGVPLDALGAEVAEVETLLDVAPGVRTGAGITLRVGTEGRSEAWRAGGHASAPGGGRRDGAGIFPYEIHIYMCKQVRE